MENLPAKQTQQPVGLISEATSGQLQIRHLKNSVPIEQSLPICFQAVGLRPKHFPSKDPQFNEWQFLVDFVRTNYGGLTAKEIVLAFKLAAQHKLDIPKDNVSPYDNFSPEYFGRIMTAYQEYKRKHITTPGNNKQVTLIDDQKHDRKKYYKDNLFDKYRELLNGKYAWTETDEWFLYKSLMNLGIDLSLPKETIEAYKNKKDKIKGNRFLTKEKQESELRDKYMRKAFRTWVNTQAENLIDIEEQINKLI